MYESEQKKRKSPVGRSWIQSDRDAVVSRCFQTELERWSGLAVTQDFWRSSQARSLHIPKSTTLHKSKGFKPLTPVVPTVYQIQRFDVQKLMSSSKEKATNTLRSKRKVWVFHLVPYTPDLQIKSLLRHMWGQAVTKDVSAFLHPPPTSSSPSTGDRNQGPASARHKSSASELYPLRV